MAIERAIRDVHRRSAFAFDFRDADGESLADRDLVFELLLDRDSDEALVTLEIGDGIELDGDEDDLAAVTLSAADLDRAAGDYWWVITDTSVPVPLAHGPFIIADPRAGEA